MIDVSGGKWKVDANLVAEMRDWKELTDEFLERFNVNDEQLLRTRTFILDTLHKRTEADILQLKETFEEMAYSSEDRRRA